MSAPYEVNAHIDTRLRYINLGCGSRYHPDWINIDIAQTGPKVVAHDLSKGIPFPDNSCDVIYHSHLLEHLRRPHAFRFMHDCFRVLKPGGILRVVVPDLEQICRVYLDKLAAALRNDPLSGHDYQWILLEMFDQTVRERSGGEMLTYLSQVPLPNEAFVYERIGEEGRNIVNLLAQQRQAPSRDPETAQDSSRDGFNEPGRRLRFLPATMRRRLRDWLLGPDLLQAMEIGRFRLAGEVHQWMYDRHSLAELMRSVGLQNSIQQEATVSQIPQWASFNLDTLSDGTVVKPDSLFMEATRPLPVG
jgi:predicted SAM-dependent methyltransferase